MDINGELLLFAIGVCAKTLKIYNEQVKGCSFTASKGVVFK